MAKLVTDKKESDGKKKTCGVIMPTADHTEYKPSHWADVLSIIIETLEDTDFEVNLVSDDIAIGLIHERIVNNIYTNEIVICDVSSKNPNVMFELGMRLAFDKPTIIIKDERTGYSFDTGVIEHLNYPSDLRFGEIKIFKEKLKQKVEATYQKSIDEQNYSPFLKSFGKNIVSANIQQSDISEGKYILSQIESINREIRLMRNLNNPHNLHSFTAPSIRMLSDNDTRFIKLFREYCEYKNPGVPFDSAINLMKVVDLTEFQSYVLSETGLEFTLSSYRDFFKKVYPSLIIRTVK